MATALEINKDEAKDLYCKGISPQEIGLKYGVTPNTIRIWASRGKWRAKSEMVPMTKDLSTKGLAEELSNRAICIARRIIVRLEELNFTGLRDNKDAAAALSTTYSTIRKALGMDDKQSGVNWGGGISIDVHLSPGSSFSVGEATPNKVIDVTPKQLPE